MNVVVSNRQDLSIDEVGLAGLADRTLSAEGRAGVELSLSFVGLAEMSDLHLRYLEEPGPLPARMCLSQSEPHPFVLPATWLSLD